MPNCNLAVSPSPTPNKTPSRRSSVASSPSPSLPSPPPKSPSPAGSALAAPAPVASAAAAAAAAKQAGPEHEYLRATKNAPLPSVYDTAKARRVLQRGARKMSGIEVNAEQAAKEWGCNKPALDTLEITTLDCCGPIYKQAPVEKVLKHRKIKLLKPCDKVGVADIVIRENPITGPAPPPVHVLLKQPEPAPVTVVAKECPPVLPPQVEPVEILLDRPIVPKRNVIYECLPKNNPPLTEVVERWLAPADRERRVVFVPNPLQSETPTPICICWQRPSVYDDQPVQETKECCCIDTNRLDRCKGNCPCGFQNNCHQGCLPQGCPAPPPPARGCSGENECGDMCPPKEEPSCNPPKPKILQESVLSGPCVTVKDLPDWAQQHPAPSGERYASEWSAQEERIKLVGDEVALKKLKELVLLNKADLKALGIEHERERLLAL